MLPRIASALGLLLTLPAVATEPGNPCGIAPTDWCAPPPGDPCGRHRNEQECRADPRCKGMPYRGESVVACMSDGKGFWSNCHATGCISR
jgi:hypothetical protein